MEQCGIVGVNSTRMLLFSSDTRIWSLWVTLSCSSERGCSGSEMERMRSKEAIEKSINE